MPDGAQAWKMIKTPGSQNNRTAQACDRCRSKKIKCDGKRPNCTSCESVGFDCKITDKLTRRAFPRGYTESLEERVRLLEQEKKKLTDLLDLKDEQMEMMAKVEDLQEFNKDSVRQSSVASTTTTSSNVNTEQHPPAPGLTSSSEDDDECIPLPQVQRLNENSSYTGASSGVILGQVLQRKFAVRAPSAVTPVLRVFDDARGMYNNVVSIKTDLPTPSSTSSPSEVKRSPSGSSLASSSSISPYSYAALNVGSRLTCDQLVTTYFQEWHSMYSIVDQYAFLDEYQKYVEGGETDELFAVQLVLVMALASLASRAKISSSEMKRLDNEWRALFSPELQQRPGVRTAQALCLAQLYCLHTQDIAGIYHYRTQVLGIVLRSALYKDPTTMRDAQGQPLSFYVQEMRRRTYWNVFVLDTFGAAVLGSPRVLNCSYPSCEMPSNVDDDELRDELSAKNTMDTSCAYAVMTFSQILASLVDTIYSSSTTRLTPKLIIKFEDQLESWRRDLSSNLKFEFADGAPKATLAPVHQKSPILLMYLNYARILLHMPSVAAAAQEGEAFVPATLRNGAGSSVSAMQSAKTFIQVFNYLQNRNVQSTMCLNPSRMILRIGTIVLYSAVDYSRGGALLQDARVLMSGAQEYIYSQMQCGKPGCVNSETYQFFEQACDIVLGSSSEVTPVTASRKPRRSNTSSSKHPRSVPIPTNLRNPTPPLSDNDDLALELLTRSVTSAVNIPPTIPPVASSTDVLQTIALESLLYPEAKAGKLDNGVDDYLDFWSSTDYTTMYERPFYEL